MSDFWIEFFKGVVHGVTLILCLYAVVSIYRLEGKLNQLLEKKGENQT